MKEKRNMASVESQNISEIEDDSRPKENFTCQEIGKIVTVIKDTGLGIDANTY